MSPPDDESADIAQIVSGEPTRRDEQIQALQESLAEERDARREERFIFITVTVLLLDVVFFSVLDGIGGPIALVIVELLILIPLAKRLGMEEIAALLDRLLGRAAGNIKDPD